MPVRQLSQPSSAASASRSSETATSTERLPATGGESSAGAAGSSTTISFSGLATLPATLLSDEARLGHQVLIQGVVLLEELDHVLAGEEDRLQGLLLHVLLVLRGLRELLEEIHVERGLLGRDLPGQEHGAQHQVLHVEAFLLAGRHVVPRLLVGHLALVVNALL